MVLRVGAVGSDHNVGKWRQMLIAAAQLGPIDYAEL